MTIVIIAKATPSLSITLLAVSGMLDIVCMCVLYAEAE